MPKHPGRPRARNPRSVKVALRLTEQEMDLLQRLAVKVSPSEVLRKALHDYAAKAHLQPRVVRVQVHQPVVPDTPKAQQRREERHAKRLGTVDPADLERLYNLGEADDETDATPPA